MDDEEAAFQAGFNATMDFNRWRFDNKAGLDYRGAYRGCCEQCLKIRAAIAKAEGRSV